MGKLFNLDSPVMSFLGKVADLMILNIIAFIACIPIITVGASMTAMHYVLLKMARKEDGYIFRSFMKSFKENFKQATICWLIILLFIVIFVGDIFIINRSGLEFAEWMRIALIVVGVLASMAIIYIFPILARFENTIKGTLKNAMIMAILSLPKTILMLVVYCLPVALMYLSTNMIPIVFLFGISGPAYLCAMIYSTIFKKFEPEKEETDNGDNWFIEEEPEEAPPEEQNN